MTVCGYKWCQKCLCRETRNPAPLYTALRIYVENWFVMNRVEKYIEKKERKTSAPIDRDEENCTPQCSSQSQRGKFNSFYWDVENKRKSFFFRCEYFSLVLKKKKKKKRTI